MRFKAIRLVYPEVTSLQDETVAFDKLGNTVVLDETLIQVEMDKLLLQYSKGKKIKAIDSQTSSDIVALVGDSNKQKALLAEAVTLTRLETKGTATAEQSARLDDIEAMNVQVNTLKVDGNAREVLVQDATTITEVEGI